MFFEITFSLPVGPQLMHPGIVDLPTIDQLQDGIAISGGDELALLVEEFQGVPVFRVMAGGDDDARAGIFHRHRHLNGGRGRKPQVHDLDAQPHEGRSDQLADHRARDAAVAADDYPGRGAILP